MRLPDKIECVADLVAVMVDRSGVAILYASAPPHIGDCTYVDVSYEHRHMTFTSRNWDVPKEIIAEAHECGFLIGRPEWGYRSRSEWVLTERAVELYWEAKAVADGMRGLVGCSS